MKLSDKVVNIINITSIVVGIIGIALAGITIGQSIMNNEKQNQSINQVIIQGNVTVQSE